MIKMRSKLLIWEARIKEKIALFSARMFVKYALWKLRRYDPSSMEGQEEMLAMLESLQKTLKEWHQNDTQT